MEVMNSMIDKDKLVLNFIQYDETKESGGRVLHSLNFFIEVSDFLLLAQDIKSGKIAKLGQLEKARKDKAGDKYAKHILQFLGGVSATNLKKRGQERADGKSLSRQLKLTPGERQPWMLSCDHGPGEENETGLIVPKGRPDSTVRIALTDDALKKLALVVEQHIQAYLTAMYTTGEALAGYQDTNVMADYYVKKAERMPTNHNVMKAKSSLYDIKDKEVKTAFESRVDALTK